MSDDFIVDIIDASDEIVDLNTGKVTNDPDSKKYWHLQITVKTSASSFKVLFEEPYLFTFEQWQRLSGIKGELRRFGRNSHVENCNPNFMFVFNEPGAGNEMSCQFTVPINEKLINKITEAKEKGYLFAKN